MYTFTAAKEGTQKWFGWQFFGSSGGSADFYCSPCLSGSVRSCLRQHGVHWWQLWVVWDKAELSGTPWSCQGPRRVVRDRAELSGTARNCHGQCRVVRDSTELSGTARSCQGKRRVVRESAELSGKAQRCQGKREPRINPLFGMGIEAALSLLILHY